MHTITVDKLRAATSERDVVELVRQYLGEWLPEEIGRLPEECRPGKLRDAEDLNTLAFYLARACGTFEVDITNVQAIERMDAFIGQACQRVAEIQRRLPHPATQH